VGLSKGEMREAWHLRPRDGKPVFLLAVCDPIENCSVKRVAILMTTAPGKLPELAPRAPVTLSGEQVRFCPP